MAGSPPQALNQSADFLFHYGLVSGSVQYHIGAVDFSSQRHLVLDAPERLVSAQPIALFQTGDLRFTVGGDDHDLVHALVGSRFEQEGDFVYHHRMRRAHGDPAGETLLLPGDARMDDMFKFSEFSAVVEDDVAECLAVDRPVGLQDALAEHLHDFAPSRLPRPDDVPGELIGIDNDGAAALEHLGDSALPGRDSAGQANHDHAGKNSMRVWTMSLIRGD